MASRLAGIIRRGAAAASVVLALLPCRVASAQTDEAAGAPPTETDPHAAEPAGNDPSAAAPSAAPGTEPPAAAPGEPPSGAPASPPDPAPAGFPKALTPQQRLPENLQGWMRERMRGHSAIAEKPPVPAPAPFQAAPAADTAEPAFEGYKRRLHSFDERGVTVLSNRRALPPAPVAPVQSTAAVVVPTPEPVVVEPYAEESSVTETRSLRTNQLKARHLPSEQGLSWPVFAVPVAAISLTLLWLRKRRTSG